MKKNRNRNRSNKNNAAAMESGKGVVEQILELYGKNENITMVERIIKVCTHFQGESKFLHMYYYANIVSFISETVGKNKLVLSRYADVPSTDFGSAVALETIAHGIYTTLKNKLGLTSEIFSTADFSIELAAEECSIPFDSVSLKTIMDRVEEEVMASLGELNLGRHETVLHPWGFCSNTFDYNKIFAKVVCCMDEEECYQVYGVDTWIMFVSCYEIANRIYNKYTESMEKTA